MSNKLICFIHTDTNGLHKTNENVSTKNLYKFARLISVYYKIYSYENQQGCNTMIEVINKHLILKPKTINFDKIAIKYHNITMDIARDKGIDNNSLINEFKNDIKNVDIIVSHSLPFHLKTIQVECFRTATEINFSKYILIDLISFNHDLDFPKLVDLIKIYKINEVNKLDIYRELFLILYKNYKKKELLDNKESHKECNFID